MKDVTIVSDLTEDENSSRFIIIISMIFIIIIKPFIIIIIIKPFIIIIIIIARRWSSQ